MFVPSCQNGWARKNERHLWRRCIRRLVNLSAYLAEENEEIAQKFLNACDETFQFLALNRYLGSIRNFESRDLLEVRMWRVMGFEKYLVFYIPTATGIKILHLLHSATDYNRAFENE